MLVTLLVLLLTLWGSLASATDRYVVASGGASSGTCPIGTPCTLTYGLSLTTAGDTLYLRAGTYSGVWNASTGIPSGTEGNPITIRGYAAEVPQIERIDLNTYSSGTYHDIVFKQFLMDGTGLGDVGGIFVGGSNTYRLTFEDIEIRDYQYHGVQSFAASNLIFRRLHVHHNGQAAAQQRHGFYVAVVNGIIENCTIHDNYSYGIQIYDGIDPDGADGMIVRNNVVSGSTEFGGINASWGDNIQIYNNVVYDHPIYGIQLLAGGGPTGTLVAHNTLYNAGNTGITVVAGDINTSVVSNVVLGSPTAISNSGTGTTFTTNWCTLAGTGCAYNGNANLEFNLASADFLKPLASSGVQNKGTGIAAVTSDIAGTARVTGQPVDLGAYEYIVAGVDPTVSIDIPVANPYTSPTQTVSVSGTAADDDGNLDHVTFTCIASIGTCTPGSGNANGTAANWSLPTLTLASGSVALVTVTAHDATGRIGQATRTISYTAASACTHYASMGGSGDGLSLSTPTNIGAWLATPPSPGQTLCLLNGTYTGSSNLVLPPPTFAGTAGQPITIRALNDGQVLLKGMNTRPVDLQGAYGILEGVNIEGGDNGALVFRGGTSHHWIARRVIAYINSSSNDAGVIAMGGHHNLLEDCAAFGLSRKIVAVGASEIFTDTYNTVRRCWARWEERQTTGSGTEVYEMGYKSQNRVVFENLLGTRDTRPGSVPSANEGPFVLSATTNSRLLGSIGYADADDVFQAGQLFTIFPGDDPPGCATFGCTANNLVQDIVGVVAPSSPWFSIGAFNFVPNDGYNNTVVNALGVTGSRGLCDSGGVTGCASLHWGTTMAAALNTYAEPKPATVWAAVPGICYRYTSTPGDSSSTLTSVPLWPWPMNQRLKDAMVQSGRTAVDVTATIETLLGPIPAACRSDSGPQPVPTRLAFQQQPSAVLATQAMSPAVTVQVLDANNALYTAAPVEVSLTLTVPAGAVLSGPSCTLNTCTVQSSSGLATFSGLVVNLPGTYTFTATASLPQPTSTSQPFVVSALPSVATRLEITQQASTALVATALTPPLLVRVLDQNDALFTASPVTVTITLASGAGTLGGDTSNDTVNGVATFSDLTLSAAATVTLTASFTTGTADDATSTDIVVSDVAAAATVLQFITIPVSVSEDTNFTATVQVIDQYGGAFDPDPEVDITITKTAGGGTLTGGGPVTTVAGLATFTTLQLDTQPVTATLQAASGALTVDTAQVDVGPIPLVPDHLAMGAQPASTYAGYTLAPVTVRLLTAQNALVTDDSTTEITLTLTDNTEGATLSGDLTVPVTAGLATFSDLAVNLPGSYTLTAASGALTGTVSSSFTIAQAPLPLAYLRWLLNEGAPATLASDTGLVPNRWPGTITGPTWTTGHEQANALSFTAAEQDVVTQAGFSWAAGSPVTVVAWVYVPTPGAATPGGLFHVGTPNDQTNTFGVNLGSGTQPRLYWNYGALSTGGILTWDWPTDGSLWNTWVRLVVTASGTTGHSKAIYINGQLQSSTQALNAAAAPSVPLTGLTLGMHSPFTPPLYLEGTVEDFQVYETQWTPAQVLTDYQGAVPPAGLGSHPSSMLLGR